MAQFQITKSFAKQSRRRTIGGQTQPTGRDGYGAKETITACLTAHSPIANRTIERIANTMATQCSAVFSLHHQAVVGPQEREVVFGYAQKGRCFTARRGLAVEAMANRDKVGIDIELEVHD